MKEGEDYQAVVNKIKKMYNQYIKTAQKKYGANSKRVKNAQNIWNYALKASNGVVKTKDAELKSYNYVHAQYYQGGYHKMTVHANGTIDLSNHK